MTAKVTDLAAYRAEVDAQVEQHLRNCEEFESELREEVFGETSRLLTGFLEEYPLITPALVATHIVEHLLGGAIEIVREERQGAASDFLVWLSEISTEIVDGELNIRRDRDDPERQEWRREVYAHRLGALEVGEELKH